MLGGLREGLSVSRRSPIGIVLVTGNEDGVLFFKLCTIRYSYSFMHLIWFYKTPTMGLTKSPPRLLDSSPRSPASFLLYKRKIPRLQKPGVPSGRRRAASKFRLSSKSLSNECLHSSAPKCSLCFPSLFLFKLHLV